jgi:hypothetical protein
MKIYPKSFRPKWSFVKSVPGGQSRRASSSTRPRHWPDPDTAGQAAEERSGRPDGSGGREGVNVMIYILSINFIKYTQ